MTINRDIHKNYQPLRNLNQFSFLINKITYYLLILLIFTIPWIFTTFTEEYYEITKNFVIILFTFFLIMLWAIDIILSKNATFIKTPIDKPFLIVLISLVLATVFSFNTDTSIWGYHMRLTGGLISKLTLIFLFYFLINRFSDKNQIRNIIKLIPIAIGLFALFTILKALNILYPIFESITGSNQSLSFLTNALFTPAGNPNALSTLFLIALPYSLFLFLNKKETTNKSKAFGFILSLIFVLGIGLTTTAEAFELSKLILWLCIAGLLIFSLIYSYKQNNGIGNQTILNLILILIGLLAFYYSTDPTFRAKITPQTNFARYYEIPSETSIQVIQRTFSTFPQTILIGSGLDTYSNVFAQFRPESQNLQPNWYENYTRPNLQIESIVVESGLVGLIAYMTLAFFILKFLALNIFKARVHKKSDKILTLSISTLIFLISFVLTYHSITILFYAWLGIALLLRIYNQYFQKSESNFVADFVLINKNNPKSSDNFAPKLFSTLLLIISITIIYFLTVNYSAEIKYSQALKANDSKNYDLAYDQMVNAINLNSNRDYYHREIASIALNKLDTIWQIPNDASEGNSSAQSELSKQYLQTLISSEINKSIILDPENHENWQRAAIIYKKLTELYQGKQYGGEALQAVQMAIQKNPTSPDNYLLLGYLYQYNADPEITKLAEQAYTKAYKLQPGYFLSIVQLGQYLENQKKYELALALYTVSRDEIYYNESDFNAYLNQRIEAMRNALENIQINEE